MQINSVLKSNDFSASFRGITFYINDKNANNELLNIFIRDTEGSLNTLEGGGLKSTIIAKKGYATNNKLILFDGIIQKINKENKMKNILFEKTELSLDGISTRIIVVPKIQETSSKKLLKCFFSENNILDQTNCSSKEYKREVLQNLSKRVAKPLYVLLISPPQKSIADLARSIS